MAELSPKHYAIVIIVSLLLISGSVVATLYAVKYSTGDKSGSASRGYVNVTFTDAVLSCHKRTRKLYGRKIQTLVTDNHSSHMAHQEFLYKIFLKMDLHTAGDDETFLNYVNCFVHSGSGDIREYEVLEELIDGKPVDTSNTNLFGMPVEGN